ncbi:MAG: RHS repeat-associated core domain-containing protein, partial [Ktedonobacteraceae bacterium]
PLNGSSTSYQYFYCGTAPHQLSGLYSTGTTCANKASPVYQSSYNAWGDVTGRTYPSATNVTLAYNSLDQFVRWTTGTGSNEFYAYDAAGNRVLRRSTSGGTTTMTVYAFGLEEHLYSGNGTSQGNTYYYSLAGRLIGELTGTTPKTNIFLTDPLGSVLATFSNTAGAAALLGNQVYGPYGTQRYSSGGTMGTNKGFTGQYNDPLTGLDYYNARYYDPVVGVFLAADTVEGNTQGMNPYAYVGGNPETNNDPTGQRPVGACDPNSGYGCPPPPTGGGGGGGGHPWCQPNTTCSTPCNGASCPPATPAPTPAPPTHHPGPPQKAKCAFMCGPQNQDQRNEGILEIIAGIGAAGAIIATMIAAGNLSGGALVALLANYAKSLLMQAIRLILVGFQTIFDSAQQHNPLIDVILDGAKIVLDVLTFIFSITDTAKLVSKIRNGIGFFNKASLLFGEGVSLFKGQPLQFKTHGSLIVGIALGAGAAAFLLIGGDVVPDVYQLKQDTANYQSYWSSN